MTNLENELDKKVFHLKTLNDISQEIFFLKEPIEILPKLLLMVMGSYGSMQGLVYILDDKQLSLEALSQRGVEDSIQDDLAYLIATNDIKSMVEIDRPIHLDVEIEKSGENFFLDFLISHDFTIFSPFKYKNKIIGGLALGEKLLSDLYSFDDLELLGTLANQGAISVENARLQQRQLNQERLRKELEIATNIQLSFLPSNITTIQGLDLAAIFQPAKEVGGDFYDFIELPENKLGVVIADVCGKGLPAALHMALTRALIRACASHEPNDMTEVLLNTNSLIQQCASMDIFVTLLFSIYNSATGKLRYVRAGHNYPIRYRKNTHNFDLLKGDGVALGIFSSITLEEKEISLEKGDIVIFYTDGISEALSDDEEMFGVERIKALVEKYQNYPANIIAENIKSAVVNFEGDGQQFDDLTLVIMKKTST